MNNMKNGSFNDRPSVKSIKDLEKFTFIQVNPSAFKRKLLDRDGLHKSSSPLNKNGNYCNGADYRPTIVCLKFSSL